MDRYKLGDPVGWFFTEEGLPRRKHIFVRHTVHNLTHFRDGCLESYQSFLMSQRRGSDDELVFILLLLAKQRIWVFAAQLAGDSPIHNCHFVHISIGLRAAPPGEYITCSSERSSRSCAKKPPMESSSCKVHCLIDVDKPGRVSH